MDGRVSRDEDILAMDAPRGHVGRHFTQDTCFGGGAPLRALLLELAATSTAKPLALLTPLSDGGLLQLLVRAGAGIHLFQNLPRGLILATTDGERIAVGLALANGLAELPVGNTLDEIFDSARALLRAGQVVWPRHPQHFLQGTPPA